MSTSLPRASLTDTAATALGALGPSLLKGPILRRPRMVGLAERLALDRRSVRVLQRLRRRYGDGPLMLRAPGRPRALILAPDDVRRVLEGAPTPFTPAGDLKRSALAHFEPKGALVTQGPERAERRALNERVLDHGRPMHHLADRFARVVREEAAALLASERDADGVVELGWGPFADAWFRVVRRIVFGDAARDDEEVRRLVDALRADGNLAFARPRRDELRRTFFARLQRHLDRAEPGSLASVMAALPAEQRSARVAPLQQVPQWLFAFDPAGMTTFRALALLASHPDAAARAHDEIEASRPAAGEADAARLPFLRACVWESLRLWPTTPLVLRQTTEATDWSTGTMPAGTTVFILAPFFHRDDERLDYADRFAPELWSDAGATVDWPLIPFSSGPAICPGRHLVLLATSTMLAALLEGRRVRSTTPRMAPPQPLPATLDNYTLRFELTPVRS